MPEIVKPKVIDLGLAASPSKSSFNTPDALALVSKDVRTSKGFRHIFQKTNEAFDQWHFPSLPGFGDFGFQVDDLVFKVNLVPSKTQNSASPHCGPISQLNYGA